MGRTLKIATVKEAQSGEKIESWQEIDDAHFMKAETPQEIADSLAKELPDIENLAGDPRPGLAALRDIAECPPGKKETKAIKAALWFGLGCGLLQYQVHGKSAVRGYPFIANNEQQKSTKEDTWTRRKAQYDALKGKPMNRYRKIVKTEHPTWRSGDRNFEDAVRAMKEYFSEHKNEARKR